MQLYEKSIFHIYNQGNNRQQIFFEEADYFDFLHRMRRFLLPHLDFLAYCLMPNHFHFLVYINQINAVFPKKRKGPTGIATVAHTSRNLHLSIGILLRTYTAYFNKKNGMTGSLFRQKTKAKEDWISDFITVDRPEFFGQHYGLVAFNYIHNNPLDLDEVKELKDWAYSSYLDYAGLRNGTLCNKVLARELLGIDF